MDNLVDVIVNEPHRSIAKDKLATFDVGTSKEPGAMKPRTITAWSECELRRVSHKTMGVLVKTRDRNLIVVGEATGGIVVGVEILLTNHVRLARTVQQLPQLELAVLKDDSVVSLALANVARVPPTVLISSLD